MRTKELFWATFPFIKARILLGLLDIVVLLALLGVMLLLGSLFGVTGMGIMAVMWLSVGSVVHFLIINYGGFMVKAGHVAVVSEALVTGEVPKNQIKFGKDMVLNKFGTSNVYFIIDKLVNGAVKQIQNVISNFSAGFIVPGTQAVGAVLNFFVGIALNYVDECCLGYCFQKKNEGPFKSSTDAVVLYAQNWKPLLKGSAFTGLKVAGLLLAIGLIVFIPVGILFRMQGWDLYIGIIVALMITAAVKYAVIDAYIMIDTMRSFFEVVPNTKLSFDLYDRLTRISRKFKELWRRGREEIPEGATPSSRNSGSGFGDGFGGRQGAFAGAGAGFGGGNPRAEAGWGREKDFSKPGDSGDPWNKSGDSRGPARYSGFKATGGASETEVFRGAPHSDSGFGGRSNAGERTEGFDRRKPAKKVVCNSCGTVNDPNAHKCKVCGLPID